MNLTGLLSETLGGGAVSQISETIGADESTTSSAIQAALPMLIGGLARNSQSDEGASSLLNALNRDHDGSILDNLGGLLGNVAGGQGAGILGHILGGRQGQVEQGISAASGLDLSKVAPLLMILAPMVMGALGRANQQQGGLDIGSLAGLLGGAHNQMSSSSPVLGILGGLLDRDHDGSALDDILGMAGRMIGGR
jgi:hypothetical protein